MNQHHLSAITRIGLFAGIAFFAQILAHILLCGHGEEQLSHIFELVIVAIIFSAASWRIKAVFDRLEHHHQQTGYALRDSQEKLKIAMDAAGLCIWEWEPETGVVQRSAQYDALFGLADGEFAGTYDAFLQMVHPDDRSLVEQSLMDAKRQKTPWKMDYRIVHPDGSIHWMSGSGKYILNHTGQILRMLGVVGDITQQKQTDADLRRLNETLETRVQDRTIELSQVNQQLQHELSERKQAEDELRSLTYRLKQSNEELENFAFIASHDLKEPLRTIHNFSGLLESRYHHQLDTAGQDYIQRIRRACRRMQTQIDDLLALSQITTQAQPFVSVDLHQIVSNVLLALEAKIQETQAEIAVEPLPTIAADPGQIYQLLQNLISNALKFHGSHPPRIKIYSYIANHPIPPPDFPRDPKLPPDPADDSQTELICQILVEDQGIGLDEQYLDRIFKPFERLQSHNEYDGTGMGLAICRKIAERHNGSVTVQSKLGHGATFIVSLPMNHPVSDL
ncbi:PAS domain-containing sensor histidine kinase [Egbenema bharatensis]|uniref:PAS domain-containing sensor histidine kinase n=1 Tax=Egbenema bharatensis TaxID=3463334 RepID=UPI003A86D808